MVDGDIVIGDIRFDNSEVNNSALEHQINAFALQASSEYRDNCLAEFKQKVAAYSV